VLTHVVLHHVLKALKSRYVVVEEVRLMNSLRIGVLVLTLVVLVSAAALAADRPSDATERHKVTETVLVVDPGTAPEETVEQIIKLMEEHIASSEGEDVSLIIEERVEPDPLGQTVTLEFAIEGESEPVTVSTALSRYSVTTDWTTETNVVEGADQEQVTEDYFIDVGGTISVDERDNTFLVSCWGSFSTASTSYSEGMSKPSARGQVTRLSRAAHEEVHTGSNVDFEASAVFQPGQTRTIASQGNQRLLLTITVDSND